MSDLVMADDENTKELSNSWQLDDETVNTGLKKKKEDVEEVTTLENNDDIVEDAGADVIGEESLQNTIDIMIDDSAHAVKVQDIDEEESLDSVQQEISESVLTSNADIQAKYPSDTESSPASSTAESGRKGRKRKPSRYHDSMFDIPTQLMNINRTINPEEFRAFHSKASKNKEKMKKLPPIPESMKEKPISVNLEPSPPVKQIFTKTPEFFGFDSRVCEDDVLDVNNMFKFKMRKDHVIQNAVGGPSAYRCDICMMSFPRSFSLRRHYTRRHINPRYVLPKAGSINVTDTETPAEWAEKVQEEITEDDTNLETKQLYACKMCSKELIYFKHKHELRTHCLESHNNEPRRSVNSVFKCEMCKRAYSTRHELQRHKRTHSGEKPYACSYCSKTFPTSTNARRHERTHTGDKPHVCKVCNKGFIQKTDMIKHLRSVHKMKVTKTKAERGGLKKTTGISFMGQGRYEEHSDLYGADGSNEFQENIDFAAYLKLDQHDSGTLMGEKRAVRTALLPNTAKGQQENNSNNHQTSGSVPGDRGLQDLPPTITVGSDGRLEKSHRCPDCSKMFTSNINLRRHHKLKHERNQLYQSAEPVSMVVEKYKIKDDNSAALLYEQTQKIQQQQLETESENLQKDVSTEQSKDEGLLKNESDKVETQENEKASENKANVAEKQKVVKVTAASKMNVAGQIVQKKSKGLSKLSSIVQRLADRQSAEQPQAIEKNIMKNERSTSPPDLQPMIKLEQMETQMFKDYFSTDSMDDMSPKRKRRKPNNIQHVRSPASFDDKLQSCIENGIIPKPRMEQTLPRQLRKHPMAEVPKSQVSRLVENERGPFERIFRSDDNKIPPPKLRKLHPHDDVGRVYERERMMLTHEQQMRKKFYEKQSQVRDTKMGKYPDISKSFAPLTSRPFPVHHAHQKPQTSNIKTKPEDKSRMQTFLSQCWSSRRHDIPKNAILNKSMPSRNSNEMNKNLRYHMRHNPSERINEHLPPSAYFSQSDALANIRSPPYGTNQQPLNFSKQEKKFPKPNLSDKLPSKTENNEDEGENSPLDLRVASKKIVPDYVVTDDGVLDFSRKATETRANPPSTSKNRNIDPMKIKMERTHGLHDERYLNNSPQPPIPRPMFNQFNPDNRPGRSQWPERSPGYIPEHTGYHQMPEHRRAIVHGKNISPQSKKPFKFHPVNFKPPPIRSPGPNYPMNDMRKGMPPPPLKSFRDYPHMPHHLPPNVPPPMPIPPEHRRQMPGLTPNRRPLPNPPPGWRVPKQEMPMHHMHDHPHKNHMSFHHGPPYSVCTVPPMPLPRRRSAELPRKPALPFQNKAPPELPIRSNAHIREVRPIIPKPPVHKPLPPPPPPTVQYKVSPASSHSPRSFCEEDMLDRCIRKAQQALKVESSSDLGGPDSGDLRTPVTSPLMRPSASLSSPNKNRLTLAETSIPETKTTHSSCPPRPPRVSAHVQDTVNTPKKTNVASVLPRLKNADSLIGPPPPLFPDTTDVKQSDDEEKRIQDVHDEKSSDKDNSEAVDDNNTPRQNLTMTPDLDCAQDDSPESLKTSPDDKQIKKTDDAESEVIVPLENIADEELVESEDIMQDILNKKKESSVITTVDDRPTLTEYSIQNPSDSPSSTSCPELLSSEMKSTLSKVSHRRHTHTHRSISKRDSSHKKKSLKRSNSSETPQSEGLPEDESSKKVIKKLKLRVIKSPGSEHKKYWTLVNQEQQSNLDAKRNLEITAQEIENTISDKNSVETKNETAEKNQMNQLELPKPNEEISAKEEKVQQISEETSEEQQEVQHCDSVIEIIAPLSTVECPNTSEDDSNKQVKTINDTGAISETIKNEPGLDGGYSILTDDHVESALSAILSPSKVNNNEPGANKSTEELNNDDVSESSSQNSSAEAETSTAVAQKHEVTLKPTLDTVELKDVLIIEPESEKKSDVKENIKVAIHQSTNVKENKTDPKMESGEIIIQEEITVTNMANLDSGSAIDLDLHIKTIEGAETKNPVSIQKSNISSTSKNSDDNIFTRMTKDEIHFEDVTDTNDITEDIVLKEDAEMLQIEPTAWVAGTSNSENESEQTDIVDETFKSPTSHKLSLKSEELDVSSSVPEEPKFVRTTRSTVANTSVADKKSERKTSGAGEKTQNNTKTMKKSETVTQSNTKSNRVRRSQRIRKSSSDKDATTKKKKSTKSSQNKSES